MKRKIVRIPKSRLDWRKQYAKVGDWIKVYPFMENYRTGFPTATAPILKRVIRVDKNKFGRVSYYTNDGLVLTEELTPMHHAGIWRG